MHAISSYTLTHDHRIEDDGALRAKVEEAMAVYDEYVKAQDTPEAPKQEEKTEDKA